MDPTRLPVPFAISNEVEILAARSRGKNLVLGSIRAREREGAVVLGFQCCGEGSETWASGREALREWSEGGGSGSGEGLGDVVWLQLSDRRGVRGRSGKGRMQRGWATQRWAGAQGQAGAAIGSPWIMEVPWA